MNEKNLVICDKEFHYAESLGENISKHEELTVKVFVCSNLEHVLQFLQDRPIHLFLVDEKYAYEERCLIKADQTFVLSKGKVADLGENESSVCKYQNADEIIREIIEVYTEKTQENVIRTAVNGRAKLVAVYSPIHRVGKTRFAIALGKEFAKKKRVLYLNLEEYAGFEGTEDGGFNLGDLLYYIKQGSENLNIRLQSAIRKMEELDYVLPIPTSPDLKEITLKEWESLIEQIQKDSIYELVILDIGESLQGLFSILEMCDRIYMPLLTDKISERKIRQYERNLEQLKPKKIPHVTYRFVMPENIEEYAKIRVKEEC